MDAELQSKLEIIISNLRLTEAVNQKKLSLGFADISDIKRPRMAGLNETHMMYAASLPKIAILFGLFKRMEEGTISWNSEIKQKADDMIRISSNTASTELFHLVGPEYIRDLLISEKYQLYDTKRFGGLWVGKEYGKGQAKFLDPIAGISHGATPFSVLRFYYLLESYQLLSKDWTLKMREVLAHTAFNTKFVRGLSRCCPYAITLRKAGSWKNFYADGALVFNNNKRYIITAIADDPEGEEWLEMLAPSLDTLAG